MKINVNPSQIEATINDSKCDITLVSSDKKTLRAHKLVLSKVEYFNVLLYGKLSEKQSKIEFSAPYGVLHNVVGFIYTGGIVCTDIDELLECFKFANELCYTQLETLLIERISLDTLGIGIDKVITKLLDCKHHNEKLVLSKIKELCTYKEEYTTMQTVQEELNKCEYCISDNSGNVGYNNSGPNVFSNVSSLPANTVYLCPVGTRWSEFVLYEGTTARNEGRRLCYRTVVFKPFLLRYLLLEFPHITQSNIDVMFAKYPTQNSKNVYIMGFAPFTNKSPNDSDVMYSSHILCLHYDEPNTKYREERLLIKLHLDKIQAAEEAKIKVKYML